MKKFNILETESWDMASDKQLFWQGKPLKKPNGSPMLENEAVSFLVPLIQFMGKKKQLTKEYVTKIITNTLDKVILNDEISDEPSQHGKFDPRNTTTYQYADYNKQLVIDGVPIYRYERDSSDRFIKKPIDEGNFANNLEFMIKYIPDYQLKNGYQAYLNDCIQWEADRCNENRKENIFGGYLFTDAMLELSAECSKGQKEKIGRIMVDYRKGGIRTSRLKQMLFDEYTGVDNYFFTDIVRAANFQDEQNIMAAYYHEYEFDTETEVYECFNNSQYLKKYPRLKEEVIKDALKWKIGKDSDSDK